MKNKDIPNSESEPFSTLDFCVAAEKVTGQGGIVGAQLIRGLWRVYPASDDARRKLLTRGVVLRNVSLQVLNSNPFILKENNQEKETTKVWIDEVPISVANSEIENALLNAGCELRSEVKMERARDKDGKLTRFLTGRRFVFVSVPDRPLEKFMKVSFFNAKIYHKEQKLLAKSVTCSKCLQDGHHASQCNNEIVCRVCKKQGHKKGDPRCSLQPTTQLLTRDDGNREGELSTPKGAASDVLLFQVPPEARGRATARLMEKDAKQRSRSATPGKRGRQDNGPSPGTATSAKLARTDNSLDTWLNSQGRRDDAEDNIGEDDSLG